MMSSSCIPDVYVVKLWLNGALMLGDFKLRSLFWWYRSFEYRNLTPVAISARAFFLSEFQVRQSLCSVKRDTFFVFRREFRSERWFWRHFLQDGRRSDTSDTWRRVLGSGLRQKPYLPIWGLFQTVGDAGDARGSASGQQYPLYSSFFLFFVASYKDLSFKLYSRLAAIRSET